MVINFLADILHAVKLVHSDQLINYNYYYYYTTTAHAGTQKVASKLWPCRYLLLVE